MELVKTESNLWMGAFEVTNKQFALFDAEHDSRLEHGDFLQFSIEERGYPVNAPDQPVVRVSWEKAMDFCRWLSDKTRLHFTLPSEDQWQRACQADTKTPMWYGEIDADFSKFANLADKSFKKVDTFAPWKLPSGAIEELRPAISRINDGHKVSAPVGSFKANPWGLFDMHGNVAEWTLTSLGNDKDRKIVRGGSWYDRPANANGSSKLYYLKWAGIYDVGFRVVCTDSTEIAKGNN
jgi:formylglycine-generating enzyme required for sulfatase activity